MKKYVIVPAADGLNNYTMLNHSTSLSFSEVRTDSSGNYLFEAKDGNNVNSVFDSYRWYSQEEIREEIKKVEWQ
jgi:hypothetical protein